jgi:hypothetical protein
LIIIAVSHTGPHRFILHLGNAGLKLTSAIPKSGHPHAD